MRRRSLLALAAAVAACADADTALGPSAPAFDIRDARSESGHPHFFWLPPIGTPGGSASPPALAVSPEVHICMLAGDACGDDVALFTTEGTGDDAVRTDGAGVYFVNWHTRSAHDGAGVIEGATYRIRVIVDGQEIGVADVRPARGNAKRSIDSGSYVVIESGQTLPIRFRIEEGAVGEQPGAPLVQSGRGVAAGLHHACALTVDGSAYCWGSGWSGELGDGEFGVTTAPVLVAGDHRFSALALGSFHTCGLDLTGATWCWGSNSAGTLGTGAWGASSATPVPVVGAPGFVELEAGNTFTCGRTAAGSIHCWGRGLAGQLGDGVTFESASPVTVAGGQTFTAMAAGSDHICALTGDGAAWCWGANLWGQLGTGTLATTYPFSGGFTPQAVVGAPAFAALSAGGNHTCGLTAAGEGHCWGAGHDGQLGDGTLDTRTGPVPIVGGHTFRSIDAGVNHTCAVAPDGSGWCWGSNTWGQTGTGIPGRVLEPAAVPGEWTVIRSGDAHSCGITPAGAGMCWGSSSLGTGDASPSETPVPIAGGLTLATG